MLAPTHLFTQAAAQSAGPAFSLLEERIACSFFFCGSQIHLLLMSLLTSVLASQHLQLLLGPSTSSCIPTHTPAVSLQ